MITKYIYKLNFVTILLFLTISIYGVDEHIGRISGDVSLDLEGKTISADLKYEYIANEQSENEIKFYLNGNFDVKDIRCENCRSFKFDKKAKPLPSIIITLKKSLPKGMRLPIKIKYEGSLKDLYFEEFEFLELGLDHFWFPIHKSFSEFKFLYKLKVKVTPAFQLFTNGKAFKKGEEWLVESRVADFDIDLVLGKNLEVEKYREDSFDLQVVSGNLPVDVPAALLEKIRETLEFYNSTFGVNSPQKRVTAVIRTYPPIPGNGGYFRKGYFVLSKSDDAGKLFFPVAHELAHNWWIGANQQNAWLNESFAEYSAMLAVRKLNGKTAFDEILAKKTALNKDLPPVYGFDRTKNPKQTPLVLYVKGAIKLYELENILGEAKFMTFLQKAFESKIVDTDKLIELVAQISSRKDSEEFLDLLKK